MIEQAIQTIRERWPQVVSPSEEVPVFILAAGWRSGSTLLQRMLLRECLAWGEPYGDTGLLRSLTDPLRWISADHPYGKWFIDDSHWSGPLENQWIANLYPPVQRLLNAHIKFLETMCAEPAYERGFSRWGVKEVRYGIEYAIYLRWLFPRAKFLFLVRSPYDCWSSYRRFGGESWPLFLRDGVITTPEQFGAHWLRLASGFHERHGEVGGLVLRYEDLTAPTFDPEPVNAYLDFSLDMGARAKSVGASPPGGAADDELAILSAIVQPLAGRFGYASIPAVPEAVVDPGAA